jgi:haloalkane dehalogenase
VTEIPLSKKTVSVLGHQMAYHERGSGSPIIFLHGNPTSSYLWRNVIPELEGYGRLIAPDMIGTGDSQKLPDVEPDTYSFQTHRDHVEAFIEAVIDPSEKILFVIHDWGSAYGFDWANRHRDRVRGFAYMESIVRPYASWDEWGALQPLFQAFRSPEGERLILEENTFVEQVLFGSIPKLTEAEYAEYRRPFLKNEDRWPTLKWPRSIPIAGAPADVVEIVQSYATWMAENELPKLFFSANPGAILTGAPREFARSWKNQTEIRVKGQHFVQENEGKRIGRSIADWIDQKKV